MAKRAPKARKHESGKWFAPPSGGYSGLGPNGEIVVRRGVPPKIPATAAGVQRLQEERLRAKAAS